MLPHPFLRPKPLNLGSKQITLQHLHLCSAAPAPKAARCGGVRLRLPWTAPPWTAAGQAGLPQGRLDWPSGQAALGPAAWGLHRQAQVSRTKARDDFPSKLRTQVFSFLAKLTLRLAELNLRASARFTLKMQTSKGTVFEEAFVHLMEMVSRNCVPATMFPTVYTEKELQQIDVPTLLLLGAGEKIIIRRWG